MAAIAPFSFVFTDDATAEKSSCLNPEVYSTKWVMLVAQVGKALGGWLEDQCSSPSTAKLQSLGPWPSLTLLSYSVQ